MPEIPTYQNNDSTRTGSTGPEATPADFGAQIGAAQQSFGQDVIHGARAGARAVKMAETKSIIAKKMDDASWAATSYQNEKERYAEWANAGQDYTRPVGPDNPPNSQAENFAGLSKSFTEGRMGQYGDDSAPSPEALKLFKDNFGSYASDQYDRALNQSYGNKVNAAVDSVDTQIQAAVSSYRKTKANPGGDPMGDLVDSVAHISSSIDSTFGKFAPQLARKKQSDLTTEAVMAAADDSPEAARSILDNSDSLDQQTYERLDKYIDGATKTRDQSEVDAFNTQRANLLTQTDLGKNQDKIPLETYRSFYSEDQAQKMKDRDDSSIDVMLKTNKFVGGLAPQAAQYQQAELAKMRSGIQTEQDMQVYEASSQKVMQNLKMQDTNTAGWLQLNNPQVQALYKKASEANDTDRTGAIKALNDAVIKYQGPAPTGRPFIKQDDGSYASVKSISVGDDKGEWVIPTIVDGKQLSNQDAIEAWKKGGNDTLGGPFKSTDAADKFSEQYHQQEAKRLEEKKQYLDLPESQWHVMALDDAQKSGDQLNASSPKEFVKNMGQVLARYPDDKSQILAFNDLVTLGKLNQQYQLAWQNKDHGGAAQDAYLGAITAGSSLKVDEKTQKDLENRLETHGTWKAFSASMIGDNIGRAHTIDGFRQGITQFAKALVTQGRSPKDAMEFAISDRLSTTMGFPVVNGKPMMILRDQGPGITPYTDSDMKLIGDRLGFSLNAIDPKDVDASNFKSLAIMGPDATRQPGMDALKNAVKTRGFWQTGTNGNSVTLYYSSDNKLPFQVRSKNGQPFSININEMMNHPYWSPVVNNEDGSYEYPAGTVNPPGTPMPPQPKPTFIKH